MDHYTHHNDTVPLRFQAGGLASCYGGAAGTQAGRIAAIEAPFALTAADQARRFNCVNRQGRDNESLTADPRRPKLGRMLQASAAAEDKTRMPPVSAEPRTGRPSQQQAAALTETILDIATGLFLREGYGSTSIEMVAERARISKRTFYHRFRDKAHLFEAVVRRLIDRWRSRLPPSGAEQEVPADRLEEALQQMAMQILEVALSTEALALHRVVLAEAPRFPDLAHRLDEYGMGQAVTLIAALLGGTIGRGRDVSAEARFAAEHFIHMVVSVPQRRALGFDEPFERDELERWVRSTVHLFLDGWRHPR